LHAAPPICSGGLTLGGTSGGTKTAVVSGSGTTYDVAVSGMTSDGTVTAKVNANAAQDAATNGNTASATASVTYDTHGPTVTINQAGLAGDPTTNTQSDPTSTAPIKFTVVFSEPVSDFTNADVDLSLSTAGGTLVANVYDADTLNPDHKTYVVKVNGMTTAGDVIARIGANKAIDAAGNGNAASTSTDNKVTWQPTLGKNTPTVYIDAPPFGSVYAKGSASLTLKAHFTDPDNGP